MPIWATLGRRLLWAISVLALLLIDMKSRD